jgi:hypothetical protein
LLTLFARSRSGAAHEVIQTHRPGQLLEYIAAVVPTKNKPTKIIENIRFFKKTNFSGWYCVRKSVAYRPLIELFQVVALG